MIKLGDLAPDFTATTTLGDTLQLSKLRGKPVALYFFPKAFTPGCSRQAAQFQDHYDELKALGAEVVGVSTDDHLTQCDFAGKMEVKFPMVGDSDGSIARRFDVFWPFFKLVRRVTFLIDPEGRIKGVYQHEIRIGQHVDQVLAAVRKMSKAEGRS